MENSQGLKFIGFDVAYVHFERATSEKNYTFKTDIQYEIGEYSNEGKKFFNTIFTIKLKSEDEKNDLKIEIKAFGQFEITGEFSEDVLNNFKLKSSPIIVFPYLRTYLSNFTVMSGLNPITLPPINFNTKK